MTKYMKLYGVEVDHFPNEKENVKEKLRLATLSLNKHNKEHPEYTYENQCSKHEMQQAINWARKILSDIENN